MKRIPPKNTGEMWSIFLVPVNNCAAAFWNNWRPIGDVLGHPDSNELRQSSFSSFSASSGDRMFLMFIMSSERNLPLGLVLCKGKKDMSWLISVELEAYVMQSRLIRWSDKLSLRCIGPSKITSVLSELKSKKLQLIQTLMSSKHASSLTSWLAYVALLICTAEYHLHNSENWCCVSR